MCLKVIRGFMMVEAGCGFMKARYVALCTSVRV